jgi:copper chaperone CopZ
MKSNFSVPAIHCGHCAKTIQIELGDLVGVAEVDVNVEEKRVEVTYTEAVDESAIRSLLTEIGYPAE